MWILGALIWFNIIGFGIIAGFSVIGLLINAFKGA